MRWSWSGMVALVLAISIGVGFAVAVIVAALRPDELDQPLLYELGAALVGGVLTWLGGRGRGDGGDGDDDVT